MPLKVILYNPRAGLIFSNCIGAIIVNAVTFNIPLYFQAVLLESATSSGLRLVIPTLFASTVGTATGFLITCKAYLYTKLLLFSTGDLGFRSFSRANKRGNNGTRLLKQLLRVGDPPDLSDFTGLIRWVGTRRLKWPLISGTILLLLGTTGLSLMKRGLPNWTFLVLLIPSSMGQGFMFPATFMAVLVVSEQSEQAVVTSALILWRSIGMILGVALSSLLLQNALLLFLDMKVSGPEKDEVNSTRSLGRNTGAELRTGHPKSPPIRKGDCGSRTFLPGTGYRCLFIIFEGCLHHGSCSIPCHDFDYCSYPAPKTGTKEEMSIGG